MESQCTVVCVRFRPASAKETGVRCVSTVGDQQVHFQNQDRSMSAYCYDKVYGEDASQGDVFDDCRHIVASVLNGYNGTILAYGQTGSGKTHTLIGSVSDSSLRGIVPRAVQALGEGIAADSSGAEYEVQRKTAPLLLNMGYDTYWEPSAIKAVLWIAAEMVLQPNRLHIMNRCLLVRLSVLETYCERIRDLLDPSRDNLPVMQDASGAIFVDGALEAQVGSEEQLVQVMNTGLAARTVAATCMNEQSSRSHCIVTVTVEKCCPDGTVLVGKLKMVDLAGSERQDKTQAAGQTLVEGSQINKSLSALANVIYALTDTSNADGDAPAKHVPYRDSKLTRILQDSLGGTSRTMLIICCSPCTENGPETLSSLRFGTRARGIKNKVAVNTRLSPEVLQQQLAKVNARIKELEQQLVKERQRATAPAAPVLGAACLADITTAAAATLKPLAAAAHDSSSSAEDQTDPSDRCSSVGSSADTGAAIDAVTTGHGSCSSTCRDSSSNGLSGSNFKQQLLRKQLSWWQHMALTGLSVMGTMVYMSWEASWQRAIG